MRKKLFAGLITLMMILIMIPATSARAEEGIAPRLAGDEDVDNETQQDDVVRLNNTTYKSLSDALDAANDDDTLYLLKDITLGAELKITKSVTITSAANESKSNYTINAKSTNLQINNLIEISAPSAKVTFANLNVDAKQMCRVIKISAGSLTIDNVNITGGKLAGDQYSAGVFVTGNASFTMKSGSITGNTSDTDQYYKKYSQDLWIGANANGSYTNIESGTIGYAFVNANEYSANNPGSFVMNGGTIENLYVEYDKEYGASFTYKGGTINTLNISTTTSGKSTVVTPEAGTVYRGGFGSAAASVEGLKYASIQDAVNAADGKTVTLIRNADITNEDVTIESGKTVTLDLNGYTLKASSADKGHIKVNGNLIFKDSVGSGKLYTETGYDKNYCHGIIELFGGSMTMESGYIYTVIADPENNGQFAVVLKGEGSSFTMNGGKIEAGWYAVSGNGRSENKISRITINGGELISVADYAIYSPQSKGTVTVNSGTISGAAGAISINCGWLEIYNGTITSENIGNTGVWADGTGNQKNAAISLSAEYGGVTCWILDGNIVAKEGAPSVILGTNQENLSDADAPYSVILNIMNGNFKGSIDYGEKTSVQTGVYVYGGLFDMPVLNEHCVTGYEPITKANGVYSVVKPEIVDGSGNGNVSVFVYPANSVPKVSDTIPEESKEAAAEIAASAGNSETLTQILDKIASKAGEALINDEALIEEAKEKLNTDEANIQISVKPRVETEVKTIREGGLSENEAVISIDIKLYYDVYAKTIDASSDSAPQELKLKTVSVTDPKESVTISFAVSDTVRDKLQQVINAGKKLYIEHPKSNGEVYYHEATLEGNIVTFVNNAGFSNFTLMYGSVVPTNKLNKPSAPENTPNGDSNNNNSSNNNNNNNNNNNSNNNDANSNSGNQAPTLIYSDKTNNTQTSQTTATGAAPAATGDSANILVFVGVLLAACHMIVLFERKRRI